MVKEYVDILLANRAVGGVKLAHRGKSNSAKAEVSQPLPVASPLAWGFAPASSYPYPRPQRTQPKGCETRRGCCLSLRLRTLTQAPVG